MSEPQRSSKKSPSRLSSSRQLRGGRFVGKGSESPDPKSAQEDRELIERACFGDEDAFASLVRKYQDRTVAIARHFVFEEESARDVAQEAFLRVYRNLHVYDPQMRFYTWFYRIVVHLAIDQLRRQRRVPQSVPDPSVADSVDYWGKRSSRAPGDRLEVMETRSHVKRILEKVPERYRQLLVLRDLEGFTSKEIAEIAGWNHATVRWRLHRARKIFRAAWEAEGLPGEV